MVTNDKFKIFLVDDNPVCINSDKRFLGQIGYQNVSSFTGSAALLSAIPEMPNLIFLNYYPDNRKNIDPDCKSINSERNGIDLLDAIIKMYPHTAIVPISEQKDVLFAVNSLKHGAFDYLIRNEYTLETMQLIVARVAGMRAVRIKKKQKSGFRLLVSALKTLFWGKNLVKLACVSCLVFSGHLFAQKPNTCASVGHRANSNGGANSCPNVSGTAYASNFVGTAYATVPASAKTGDFQLSYAGANTSLLPYAITNVWLTTTGTVQQSTAFGPAGVPTVSGGNTLVNYCFYGTNLPTAGTLSFQLTDPQTGIAWGICSYDASCNSNCAVVTNPVIVLSVVFTDFEAASGPGTSERLKWSTAQEVNNKGFDIQRSVMDSAFASIGFVPTSNPGGNSAVQTDYEFTDPAVADITKASYRLQQVDLDGKFVYSSIASVVINNNPSGIRAYSSGGLLNISIPASLGSSGADVTVYDTQGRTIRRQRIATSGDFQVSGLPGQTLYFVVVVPNNGIKKDFGRGIHPVIV